MLVQTLAPDAPAILRPRAHDADGFLAARARPPRGAALPAVRDLIRVVCSSRAERARGAAEAATAVRERLSDSAGLVLGPAPLFRLRGRERSQVVVKTTERAEVVRLVGETVASVASDRVHKDAAFSVDVDPQ